MSRNLAAVIPDEPRSGDDPGPIGPNIVERGRVLAEAHGSANQSTGHADQWVPALRPAGCGRDDGR